MSPRISSPVTAPRSAGLTHPCPHDDHVKSRSIREELRNRRKMPTRHFSPKRTFIAGGGPRARTREGRECRSHELDVISIQIAGIRGRLRTSALDVADDGTGLVVHELDTALGDTTTGAYVAVSLYILLSLCSELCALQRAAVHLRISSSCAASVRGSRTGTAKDTSDLDELDGGLSGIHCVRLCVRRETVVRWMCAAVRK